jgi:RNA-binding protein
MPPIALGFVTNTLLHFAPMNLNEANKKFLRGLGHQLKPLIMVGDAGLTESLLAEFESTLDHHELIKVRVRVGDRKARDEIIEKLCSESAATLIQRIGNVALLYKANLTKKPEKRIKLPLK